MYVGKIAAGILVGLIGLAILVGAVRVVLFSRPYQPTALFELGPDASATSPDDYAARHVQLEIAPGRSSAYFGIRINRDGLDEPDETFSVTLSDPLNATIADGSAIATILDDD